MRQMAHVWQMCLSADVLQNAFVAMQLNRLKIVHSGYFEHVSLIILVVPQILPHPFFFESM